MKNGNSLLSITAEEIMTRQVVTVPYDWSVDRLARFLTDKSISGAPVVDEAGQVVGVVTLSDIVGKQAVVWLTSPGEMMIFTRLYMMPACLERNSGHFMKA